MTRAKRYEGEKRRAEAWHSSRRDAAWLARDIGMAAVRPLIAGKFNAYTEIEYDEGKCVHNVMIQIGPGGPTGPMGHLPPLNILLEHREPYDVSPSEHLMTKLLLMVG